MPKTARQLKAMLEDVSDDTEITIILDEGRNLCTTHNIGALFFPCPGNEKNASFVCKSKAKGYVKMDDKTKKMCGFGIPQTKGDKDDSNPSY